MEQRWTKRSGSARVLGAAVTLSPIVAAVLVCMAAGHVAAWVGWPRSATTRAVVLAVVGGLVGYSTTRLARRALPLVTLLRLSLAFPDRAPSRVGVALRANRAHHLRRAIERGEPLPDSTPQEVATTLLALVGWLTIHDRQTRGHCERVCALTSLLAEELAIPDDERDQLAWAALLHDVGKVAVPAAVLNKPGPLTAEERQVVQSHTVIGHELTTQLADWLGPYRLVPLEHHEWYDGSGYPHGKSGAGISYGARIVAAADVMDVLTSFRSYQRARSWDQARAELVRMQGRQFDPVVVAAMLRCGMAQHGMLQAAGGATGGGLASMIRTVRSPVSKGIPAGVAAIAVAGLVGAAMAPMLPPPAEVNDAADGAEVAMASGADEAPEQTAPASADTVQGGDAGKRSTTGPPPRPASPGPSSSDGPPPTSGTADQTRPDAPTGSPAADRTVVTTTTTTTTATTTDRAPNGDTAGSDTGRVDTTGPSTPGEPVRTTTTAAPASTVRPTTSTTTRTPPPTAAPPTTTAPSSATTAGSTAAPSSTTAVPTTITTAPPPSILAPANSTTTRLDPPTMPTAPTVPTSTPTTSSSSTTAPATTTTTRAPASTTTTTRAPSPTTTAAKPSTTTTAATPTITIAPLPTNPPPASTTTTIRPDPPLTTPTVPTSTSATSSPPTSAPPATTTPPTTTTTRAPASTTTLPSTTTTRAPASTTTSTATTRAPSPTTTAPPSTTTTSVTPTITTAPPPTNPPPASTTTRPDPPLTTPTAPTVPTSTSTTSGPPTVPTWPSVTLPPVTWPSFPWFDPEWPFRP